jgi:hypothetical protein
MKIKTLSRLFLTINIATIPGCDMTQAGNGGTQESKSIGYKALNKTNHITLQSSGLKEDNTPYKPLPRVELGWGYDPTTDSVMPIPAIDTKKLVAPDGTYEVINEASQYNDYSKYAQDMSLSSNEQSQSFAGGIGVSYGLYSGSIKAAYGTASKSASGELTINKAVGLTGSVENHLPLNPKKLSPVELANVASAIYTASSQSFKDAINAVRNAHSDVERSEAVLNFYRSYGTHFVSSVTRGYLGAINIALTQKTSQGSDADEASIAAAFSSPFVKVDANYSQSNAATFSKQQWSYSGTTFTSPDDATIRASLQTMLTQMNDDLNAQKDALSFDKLDDYQKSTKALIKLPNLDNLNVKVDPDVQKQAKEDSIQYRNITTDLSKLGTLNTQIISLLKKRDEATDQTQKEEFEKKIQQQIADKSQFKILLDKFNPDGVYNDKTLTSLQASDLKKYNNLYDVLSMDISTTAAEVLATQNAEQKSLDRQDKLNNTQPDFTSWLKSSIYPQISDKSVTFVDWFNSITAEDISKYGIEFNKYLAEQGLVPPEGVEAPSALEKLHQDIKLRSENMLKSYAKDDSVAATLDFDLIPWATIYPELNSSAEFFSSPIDLIKIKILRKLNLISDIRSYLLLCTNQTNSKDLNVLYTNDSLSPEYNKLVTALHDFTYGSNTVKFAGRNYSLNNVDEVRALETDIDTSINKLSMVQSNWYKVTNYLLSKGLISPQGVLLAAGRVNTLNNQADGMLSDRLINPSQTGSSYKLSAIPLQETLGQQLANIIGQDVNYQNLTGEIIVTDRSDLKPNEVTMLQMVVSKQLLVDGDWSKGHVWIWPQQFSLSLIQSHEYGDYYYQTVEVADLLATSKLGDGDRTWIANNSSNNKLLLAPLNRYNTETLKTALGGADAARSQNPEFKLFYSGVGNATTDMLYNMSNITGN